MHMELGGKLVNPLRTETQILARLPCVTDVDGATHTRTATATSTKLTSKALCGAAVGVASAI